MSTTPRTRATQMGAVAFFAVGLLCAGFAAYLVKNMISARGYTGDRVRPVVVAKHALPAAVAITPDDVDVMNWPEKHVPEGVIADPKQLFAGKALIPTTAILEGEPIVPSRLANQAQGTGLAALVRDGYRAVAVKVDDSVGRAGLVYPGATVDVLATIRDQDHGPSTRIAVSGAKVLAVESETDVATRRPRKSADEASNDMSKSSFYGTVVTLEVTPDDAEIVSLASREGKVDLALRNGTDKKPAETKGAIPLYFSAFAPDVAPATADTKGAVPTQTIPGLAERKGARGGKRIELRAVDVGHERRENPDKEIETYHAR